MGTLYLFKGVLVTSIIGNECVVFFVRQTVKSCILRLKKNIKGEYYMHVAARSKYMYTRMFKDFQLTYENLFNTNYCIFYTIHVHFLSAYHYAHLSTNTYQHWLTSFQTPSSWSLCPLCVYPITQTRTCQPSLCITREIWKNSGSAHLSLEAWISHKMVSGFSCFTFTVGTIICHFFNVT